MIAHLIACALLVFASARYAGGHVVRPIRIFVATAAAGVVAAGLTFAWLRVPHAFLAMTACLALALSVNRRLTRPPRRPLLRRGLWIAAAALMLAAMTLDTRTGSGALAFVLAGFEIFAVPVAVLGLVVAFVQLVRGVLADRADRLLMGAIGGLVAFVVLFATRLPPPAVEWLYPFSIVLGAALARANGNVRTP